MLFNKNDLRKVHSSGLGGFPNGIARVVVGWFDKIDEKIGQLVIFFENDYKSNALSFNNF